MMGADYRPNWPLAHVAILKQQWAAWITAREIGKELGRTRNSVIGKARRLGLENRSAMNQYTLVFHEAVRQLRSEGRKVGPNPNSRACHLMDEREVTTHELIRLAGGWKPPEVLAMRARVHEAPPQLEAPPPIPSLHTEPPKPDTVCTREGCRGPRQRVDRLGRCAECIGKDIRASKKSGPTLVDTGHHISGFEVAKGRGELV